MVAKKSKQSKENDI